MLATMPFKSYRIGEKKAVIFLSDLQVEILESLAEGKAADKIAEENCIASRTVNFHIENIKKLIGCEDQSELVNQWCL